MAIEGALQDVGLADICQLLSMGRKTGCLSLTDRSNFGYIYFEGGRVIYASVLDRPHRIGELLVRNGVIDREQLSAAMEAQAHEEDVRLGQLLLRMGSIDTEQLNQYVRLQIEEAVYHLFTWNQGSFHFDSGRWPEDDGGTLVSIPVENLLMEGARRVDEWTQIETKIPTLDVIFAQVKDPEVADDIEVTRHQRRVLPLIDGERTVREIIEESGLVQFDVGKALFPLAQAGFISEVGRREPADAEEDAHPVTAHLELGNAFYDAGMLEDAAREYEETLAADPDHASAHFRLGVIALRTGRLETALGSFDLLPEDVRRSYPVLRNRALALELMERFDDALAVLEEAGEIGPDDHDATLARGIVLLRKGDAESAIETLEAYHRALGDATPPPAFYAYAILAAGRVGRYDDAVSIGREGLTHHPECGELLVNQAALLREMGREKAAEALYVRATRQPMPPAQAHKALGDAAFERGDDREARTRYEKAQRLEPRLGDDLYVKLAILAERDDDDDAARLLWSRAIELNPDNEAARTHLEALDAAS
ncbi:MAG TPA: DUF4388 domain-containing protein [Longimicrobiales bacterium]|nr:DUF4388 domain-containing protein [Longimicrobiales bacterium]